MTNQFSSLEIQLIRSSLASRTDDEIAQLLEKPVEDVVAKINEITGGGAAERNNRILYVKAILQNQQQQKIEERKRKEAGRLKRQKASQERASIKKQRQNREQAQRDTIEFQMHQHHKKRRERESRQTYQTKEVDWTKMKSVRVSRSTLVLVPKEMTEEEAIEQYYKNREASKRSGFEKELHQKMTPITN